MEFVFTRSEKADRSSNKIPKVITNLLDKIEAGGIVGSKPYFKSTNYLEKPSLSNLKENLKLLSKPETAREWQSGFNEDFGGDVLRSFINNWVAPAAQIPHAAKEAVAGEKKTPLERGLYGATLAGNVASTLLPGIEDLLYMGFQGLKGYGKAGQEGKSQKEKLLSAKRGVTGQEYAGLGEAITTEPNLQAVANLAEIPLALLVGGVRTKNIDENAKLISRAVKSGKINADEGMALLGTLKSKRGSAKAIEGAPSGEDSAKILDEIKGLIYSDDIVPAKELYQTIPKEIRPTFQTLVDEVNSVRSEEWLGAVESEMSSRFGSYQADINRFKKLLNIAGEKKSTKTGMLFREHIPQGAHGEPGSDEIATSLGMSENEFMNMLTRETTVGGGGTGITKTVPTSVMGTKKTLTPRIPKSRGKIEVAPGQGGLPGTQMKTYSSIAQPEYIAKQEATAREKTATKDYNDWKRQLFAQETKPTGRMVDDLGKMIKQSTYSPLVDNLEEMKDIGPLSRGWNTVYRNFKRVFADKWGQADELFIRPLNKAKGEYVDMESNLLDDLANNVTRKYGFKKGSKESAAIQRYGERNTFLQKAESLRRQAMATQDEVEAGVLRTQADEMASNAMTYEDLVKEFGQKKADQMVQADEWFRKTYNEILPKINSVLARIYPGDETKKIPYREDYYRHFNDLSGTRGLLSILAGESDDFASLANNFGFEVTSGGTPANIRPDLIGLSEYTKPKSKFVSIAQERLGLRPKQFDAIGGFLEYVPQASYTVNVSPQINAFRELRNELSSKMLESGKNTLPNFIEFLDDYSNDLAGKLNPMDRSLTKIGLTRKQLSALNWINHRVKANTILGNLSASIAQLGNLPQGIASAGEGNFIKGSLRAMFSSLREGVQAASQSQFLKERYSYKKYRQFDSGIVSNAKNFTEWMTVVLDEVGTKLIWNAHYEKALAENIARPIEYADDATRNLVGGRGIGEVPLNQKARLTQFFAPFQLEVVNSWYVMRDFTSEKQFGKLMKFYFYSWMFNNATENLIGRRVLTDPIDATVDAVRVADEEIEQGNYGKAALRASGRIVGEVAGNIPFGQTAGGFYEGLSKAYPTLPSGKEFWGESDPTRYGAETLVARGLTDPLFKLGFPFGGGQVKKTIKGTGTVKKGYSETPSGGMRFPISKSTDETLRTILFGEYSGPNALFYFNNNLRPLSANQMNEWKSFVDIGEDPVKAWTEIYKNRISENLDKKIADISNDPGVPDKNKESKIKSAVQEYEELMKKLDFFGGGRSGIESLFGFMKKKEEDVISPTTPTQQQGSGGFNFTPTQ